MQLTLSEDQTLLLDSFRRFFETESAMPRVRAAEARGGYDPALWTAMAELGLFAMRAPGADGFPLFDTALAVGEAGRQLASGPIVEALLAHRLAAELAPDDPLGGEIASGETVATLALFEAEDGRPQIVPGAAVAQAVLFLCGDEVRVARRTPVDRPDNHAGQPLAEIVLVGEGSTQSVALAKGDAAVGAYRAALEEWRLLTASALVGIGRRGLELAVDYVKEREQFGRPVGSFQAVSHPLADRLADIEAAQLLIWSALRKIADGAEDASAAAPMAWWFSAYASGAAVQRALHSFGGYGLTNEYDIQLYHRRAKAMALVAGDPAEALVQAGRRLWLGERTPLPEVGEVGVEFGFGEQAEAFACETRAFFESHLTPEWHAKSHYSYDGHDWTLNRQMGERGLLFPTWPKRWGGRDADGYVATAGLAVWDELDVTTHAQSVSNMVGQVVIRYGSEEVKAKLLPRLAAGEIITALGYSEPSSGSDVFAAKTRAVRDGDDWIIDGQKMFTSGGNLASHILLLARTNTEVAKHKGITLFIVPTDDPGFQAHPVHTFQEERTNATFYSNVRVSDAYRIGPVDGGTDVLGWALSLEQGGTGFIGPHMRTVEAAVRWARGARRDGGVAIEQPRVLERLAKAHTHAVASALVYYRSLWRQERDLNDRAAGPMSKVFSSELFLRDATDLFELAAPDTLLRGKHDLGVIELAGRHASATTIYAGTSEVHRSQVAEKALGLPRSR